MLEAFLVAMLINSQPGLDLHQEAVAVPGPQTVETTKSGFDSPAAANRTESKPRQSSAAPELVEVKPGGPERLILLEDGEWDFSAESARRPDTKYPQWGWFKQHTRRLSLQDRLWNPTGKPPLFQDWSPF